MQFLTLNPFRDVKIEEAVNLLHRPEMFIKLIPPRVMVNWLARNRRRTDPRITEEEVRANAKRVHETVGYASSIQSRGIFVWRAEKNREMGRSTEDYLFHVFDRTKQFSFDSQYPNDLFAVQRILRDNADDELEAARHLYHRSTHAFEVDASLAASDSLFYNSESLLKAKSAQIERRGSFFWSVSSKSAPTVPSCFTVLRQSKSARKTLLPLVRAAPSK